MATTPKTTISSKIDRNAHIAQLSIQGLTSKEIAARPEIDISDSSVRRVLLTDTQCKDILDHVMRVNIAHAKGINKQFLQLCYDPDKKIRLDAIKQYQKNVGITPSHTVNQFFANIYNDNRSMVTADVEQLFDMLSGQAAGQDEDVIEGEIEP